MCTLIIDIYENCAEANVACARSRRILRGRGRLGTGWRRRGGEVAENIARDEGIEQLAREREEVVLRHRYGYRRDS